MEMSKIGSQVGRLEQIAKAKADIGEVVGSQANTVGQIHGLRSAVLRLILYGFGGIRRLPKTGFWYTESVLEDGRRTSVKFLVFWWV